MTKKKLMYGDARLFGESLTIVPPSTSDEKLELKSSEMLLRSFMRDFFPA